MDTNVIGRGVYTIPEAAKYIGKPHQTLHAWFKSGNRQLFSPDYPPVDGHQAISFFDLVDAMVASTFRKHGVPMREIRNVYEELRTLFNEEHPFCKKDLDLSTDGKKIYHKYGNDVAQVINGQVHSKELMKGYLEGIDFNSETLMPERWHPSKGIVIDPARRFGKPVVEGVFMPTWVLHKAYMANDMDEDYVADLYDVQPEDVRAAVEYEKSLVGGRDKFAA